MNDNRHVELHLRGSGEGHWEYATLVHQLFTNLDADPCLAFVDREKQVGAAEYDGELPAIIRVKPTPARRIVGLVKDTEKLTESIKALLRT